MQPSIPLDKKVLYGIADMGIALVTSAVAFFLLFYYTDVAGINPAIAGTALMVGKLTWDAVNDPIFGYFSDRTRSRFGRRRIFMLIGALPLGLASWLLFSVPTGLTGAAAFATVLVTFLLFDTFVTLVSVPYYAMTPELTSDYRERTHLTAIRMIFSVLGYILGAAITTVLAGLFGALPGWSTQSAWSATGAVFGLVALLATLVTTLTIKEHPGAVSEPSKMPPLRAIGAVFRNRPFLLLMAAFIISSFSFSLLTALVSYFIIYQLDMRDWVSFVLLAMLLAIGLFLLPMQKIANRINKGPAYALGLFIASVAIITSFFFPKGSTPLIFAVAIVAGIGFSAQWVLPWSMIPDVIEYDEEMTGERREGVYYGMWALLTKFTSAAGIAVSGWALSGFGYVANVPQTDHALLGIRLFFSLIPALALLVSLPFLIWYPITQKSHAELVRRLEERRAAALAADD